MHPFLIQRPEISIGAYPFFYGLGLACAGIVEGLLLRERGYRFRDGIRLWGVVCLLIVFGGRLLYLLIYLLPTDKVTVGWFLSLSQGGEVLYGALIAGTLGGWYACRRLRVSASDALDAASVGAPLGIGIGRIGCLLKGCCYGSLWNGWCAIRYPKVFDIYGNVIGSEAYLEHLRAHQIGADDTWSLPVHPVPVYESTAMLIVAAVMFMLWKRRVLPGRLMFAFGGTYAIWRFGIEFIREREEHLIGQLTVYQAISIGVFVACLAACLFLKPAEARLASKAGSRQEH
jgi:phosphatidylglycerol:prolipoprotein diacylglycerol transferase